MNDYDIDKRAMRRAFSRAARTYDASAVLQHEVCQRMLDRLDMMLVQPARILDLGCGTGWGGRQLAVRYPNAELLACDIAPGMLDEARRHESWWRRISGRTRAGYLCADAEALPLSAASVDMVWSNLALQWVNDLPQTLCDLHRIVRSNGLLIFSTFGVDTLHELRAAFHGVDGYNHLNRFADLHDIGDMLVAAGFADPVMEMEKITLTYADVRAVMQDLKHIGAHNVTLGRNGGLMGKQRWRQVCDNYEKLRRDGRLPATFEIIYGHAWKAVPKKIADGRAIIRMDLKR